MNTPKTTVFGVDFNAGQKMREVKVHTLEVCHEDLVVTHYDFLSTKEIVEKQIQFFNIECSIKFQMNNTDLLLLPDEISWNPGSLISHNVSAGERDTVKSLRL